MFTSFVPSLPLLPPSHDLPLGTGTNSRPRLLVNFLGGSFCWALTDKSLARATTRLRQKRRVMGQVLQENVGSDSGRSAQPRPFATFEQQVVEEQSRRTG